MEALGTATLAGIIAGVVLAVLGLGWRVWRRARLKRWEVRRTGRSGEHGEIVALQWLLPEPAHSARVDPGPGVTQSDIGRARALGLRQYQSVTAHLRWQASADTPHAVLRWVERPGGRERSRQVPLPIKPGLM